MRKFAFVSAIALGLASVAAAQIPTSGNVFFGYSYYNTKLSSLDRASLNGWNGSLEGKIVPWVGIVADLSGHYGSDTFPGFCEVIIGPCPNVNRSVTEYNALFGPRVSFTVGKVRPFAEALIGVGHVNTPSGPTLPGSDTSLATGLGGGVDYHLFPLVAWRLQADYIRTSFFGTSQGNARISTGIVIHF